MTMVMMSRPTSLSDSGVQLSPDTTTSSSECLTLSSFAECDDSETRTKSRMEKYFAEKPDKNIFMKLIHPSYHERNLQFKKIFVDKGLVDESDQFLASYSCAYQREILAQGRMFISQFNVCFYANIIGWETTLVIPMKDIKLIKKMKAAFIFPNSIQFENENDEKHFFASFINRDKSYQVLTTAHQKSLTAERPMTREEVWDMVYNSEEKNPQSPTPPESNTPASTTTTSTENMTALSSRSPNGSISRSDVSTMQHKSSEKDSTSQSSTSSGDLRDDSSADAQFEEDFSVYEDVGCPCEEHFGKVLFDEDYKISLEKFYELVFTENNFIYEFNERIKVAEYVAATWVRDHCGENTRTCTYTVSLTNPMAPKAIIVNEKQVLRHYPNPRQGLIVSKETQNSGVPYSEHFTVNCQYCITRTGPRSCRVRVHGGIRFKKSVWTVVRTFIEKGTNQGLDEHYKLLKVMMDEFCVKNPDGGSQPPTNLIPFLREESQPVKSEPPTVENEQNLRHRNSRKSERLRAGADKNHETTQIDKHFVPEMRPRGTADISSHSRSPTPNSSTSAAEYTPFLVVIIVLLTFFFIANLYILQGFRVETSHVVSKKEENLGEMMAMMMEQIRELKDKVERLQKNQ